MAKEKEENLWRGKIYFPKEMKNGEGKGEKYLEKENFVFGREEKAKKEKEEIIWRGKIYFFVEEKKNRYGKEEKFGEENRFLRIVQGCC